MQVDDDIKLPLPDTVNNVWNANLMLLVKTGFEFI